MNTQPSRAKRNILVICADQLAQAAVGCYGDTWGATPTIDKLAADGVRFDYAYTPCPLCAPARGSFWSGRWPHQTGVTSNGKHASNTEVPDTMPTLGSIFSDAGYRCTHFGKTHDWGALRGFDVVEQKQVEPFEGPEWAPYLYEAFFDEDTTAKASKWLEDAPDDPWLTVVDIQNPHNICGFVGANQGDEHHFDTPEPLPELPDNFEVEDWSKLPKPVQYVCCAHRRGWMGSHWEPHKFRQYMKAYYHYTQLADDCIRRVLESLDKSGQRDNTTVVFFADHGDAFGRHRACTKHTTFYEEMTRIPFVISGAGVTHRGSAVGKPLSNLTDLVPTLCGIAGIEPDAETRAGLVGTDLSPAMRGEPVATDREYTVSQWYTEWGFTVEPGRMIRTRRYKYTHYREGDGEELYDLEADPGEKRTLIDDPAHAEALAHHRMLLRQYCDDTSDPFFTLDWKADERWRSHAPGYHHHEGPCAPDSEYRP